MPACQDINFVSFSHIEFNVMNQLFLSVTASILAAGFILVTFYHVNSMKNPAVITTININLRKNACGLVSLSVAASGSQ